jgi:hypothetical protein
MFTLYCYSTSDFQQIVEVHTDFCFPPTDPEEAGIIFHTANLAARPTHV